MIRVEIFEKVEHEWWNNLVKSVPEGTIFQTTYWSDYLNKSGKGKAYHLAFYHASEDPICMLIIYIENAWDKIDGIPQSIKDRLKFLYVTWFKGPLILKRDLSYEILQQIVTEIERICIKKNVIAIKNILLPLSYGENINVYNILEDILKKSNFYNKKYETSFIDLTAGKKMIWNSFKRDTRKDVKRGYRDNLEVRELEKEDLVDYKDLLAKNMERNKMIMPPHYPNNIMWDRLKDKGYDSLRLLAIKKEGRLCGALGLVEYNGIIFQIGSAQSNNAYIRKLNVNDLITWEAILWGANNNKRIYDLTGMAPIPSNKKEEGIKRYKLKWSNKIISYNTYSKAYKRNLHVFLTILNKIYNTIAGWI